MSSPFGPLSARTASAWRLLLAESLALALGGAFSG
jgi:hypothetical protein